MALPFFGPRERLSPLKGLPEAIKRTLWRGSGAPVRKKFRQGPDSVWQPGNCQNGVK
jgi:hypothetical protein